MFPPKASLLRGLAALLCLLAALSPRPAEAETLTLNTSAEAPRSRPDSSGFEDRIILEAFRRLDLRVNIVRLPSPRGLASADTGVIDGDCWRVGGLSAQYPNLVMVPEPVDKASIAVFTRDPAMTVAGWADLGPYTVAYINGWKILDAKVRAARSVEKVRNIESLFALLDKNRVDAVLVDLVMGQEAVRRLKLNGIRALMPLLTRQDMYLYLHKRHAALAPKLAETLRQMKRDGAFQRLMREGLAEAKP